MWDAFLAGGVKAGLPYLAEDVEWDGTNLPDGRVGKGHHAVLEHVTGLAKAWNGWVVYVEDIRALIAEAANDR